jgi:hypothetical protein
MRVNKYLSPDLCLSITNTHQLQIGLPTSADEIPGYFFDSLDSGDSGSFQISSLQASLEKQITFLFLISCSFP